MLRALPRRLVLSAAIATAALAGTGTLAAQARAHDAAAKLRAALPPEAADRILARIAAARARQLPVDALENRALELAAKHVRPTDIETGIDRHADRLERARGALRQGGRGDPSDTETEAAEVAMGKGADGSAVSAVARSAPSGRSLAVPLFVLASHLDRGLPSDQALARVHAAMVARAADREARAADREARGHRGGGAAGRPSGDPASTGRPDAVPANPGRGTRPESPRGRNRP